MKKILFIACSLIALPLRSEHALVSREVFRDAARMAVVDAALEVEACILRVQDPSKGADLAQRVFVEGPYKQLPEEIRILIIWKLLDDLSYTWDAVPACVPTYNARVRFTSGNRVVAADFCFGCSLIRILEGGEVVGGGYFAPGSDWVFQALAVEFPRDRVIRDLKKRREEEAKLRLEIEMAKAREARRKTANQALQPPMLVTPRADARVAPSTGVADL